MKDDETVGAGTTWIDEPAPPPATDGDRAQRDEETVATRAGSQTDNTPTAELGSAIDSMCLMLESAATANGLPLEFFARVIWEESRFQPNTVGPMTRSGHCAQGIAQFMPHTADERGLLDPFNPETALPKAAEFLAELRSEFGNLGLAAAAYNAGPVRVRDFIGGRGGMPARTRNYVRAVTGRSVDEWAALRRERGKDGIPKPTSCGHLATLLKEQPSFVIGKTGPNMREAALSPQESPDWRSASSGQSGTGRATARPAGGVVTRNSLQVRTALLSTTGGATRQPKTSAHAASAASGSSSAKPGQSGKSTGATGRSTSMTPTPSDSKSASGRLRAVSPKGSGRENSATQAARPTASVATRNPLQVRAALLSTLSTTSGATRQPKTSPPASGNSSAKPGQLGKSTGPAGRSTSMAPTLSDSKSASGPLRAVSPKGSAQENSAIRVTARPTGSVGTRNRNPQQVRTALLPTTAGAIRQRKTSPPGNSSAKPGQSGKSTGVAGRSTSVAPTLSDSKSASGRLRAVLPKKMAQEKAATDRLRKVMQICRGC